MGKKRIIRKSGGTVDRGLKSRSLARVAKKNIASGAPARPRDLQQHESASYGQRRQRHRVVIVRRIGIFGCKKGTPFAAAKVGELVGDKANIIGVKEVDVIIRGVGAGRESALRGFAAKGIDISKIADDTPVPHNGPRAPKPRRV